MYTDSFGVDLIVDTRRSLIGATSASIVIVPPRGRGKRTGVERTATITNATDGEVTYRTQVGDFLNSGIYQLQIIVYYGSERKLPTEVFEIEVDEALESV